MGRQTAFPGIIVESISAKAGGGGRTLEFEEGLPENIPPERIQSFLDNVNLFGSDFVESRMVYTLHVAAYTRTSAKAKARAFVRAKNPFETSFLSVRSQGELDYSGDLRAGRKAYEIKVGITK